MGIEEARDGIFWRFVSVKNLKSQTLSRGVNPGTHTTHETCIFRTTRCAHFVVFASSPRSSFVT